MTHYLHPLKRTPLHTLGDRIRTARKGKGLSQEQLAEKADMAVSYISSIERGRGNPSFKKLLALAHALGCDVAELMSGFCGE